MRDFGGDHADMARSFYGPCEDSWEEQQRETQRIERDFNRYCKERLEYSHQELVDCGDFFAAEVEGFRKGFEAIERNYQQAMGRT